MFRLYTSLLLIIALIFSGSDAALSAIGGPPPEMRSGYLHEKNPLSQKEELLRGHFTELDSEEKHVGREEKALRRALVIAKQRGDRFHSSALERRIAELTIVNAQIREARAVLVSLQRDERRYAMMLADSYGSSFDETPVFETSDIVRRGEPRFSAPEFLAYETGLMEFAWPVIPLEGLSAGFRDRGYLKRFGFEHDAIDIPTPQGTVVTAPADAKVIAANDRGFGYNTLVLQHTNGIETVYGHVGDFLVGEGDSVRKGDPIAVSGGRPGSQGAGLLTTGPHLHFEVRVHGQGIDPLYYLPPMEVALADAY
jgi:murein DD-endopeptidase MepM/ murein hydrolase activator NlpD